MHNKLFVADMHQQKAASRGVLPAEQRRRSNPNATPLMRLRAVPPLGTAEQRSGGRIRAGVV